MCYTLLDAFGIFTYSTVFVSQENLRSVQETLRAAQDSHDVAEKSGLAASNDVSDRHYQLEKDHAQLRKHSYLSYGRRLIM